MKQKNLIWACSALAFLISCSSSGNSKENYELGTLQIVDHGPAIPSSWETQITIDRTGKISSTQYAVQDGLKTVVTDTWEYQMSPAEKQRVEQESTAADVLYRLNVILPEGAVPCAGAGDLDFHAISRSGRENRFVVSGAVRCVPFTHIPDELQAVYSFISGWAPSYPL